MSVTFVDSSALIKLFVVEYGSDDMLRLYYSGSKLAISRLALVEIRSALARLRRVGKLNPADVAVAEGKIEMAVPELSVAPLDESTCALAQILLARHDLRTLDALQLAAAMQSPLPAAGQRGLMVASDRKLLAAARAEGFATFDPAAEELASAKR